MTDKVIKHKGYIIKVKNFDKMSIGDYMDIQHLKSVDIENNLLLSTAYMIDLYTPRKPFKMRFKDTKLGLTSDEKMEILKDIPFYKIIGINTFFLLGQKTLLSNTAYSLNVMATKMNLKLVFRAIGAIISGLWNCVVRMPIRSKKQQTSM